MHPNIGILYIGMLGSVLHVIPLPSVSWDDPNWHHQSPSYFLVDWNHQTNHSWLISHDFSLFIWYILYIYIYATPYFVVWNPILGIDPNSAVDILPGPSGLVGGGPAVTEVPSVSRHAIERRSCGGSGDLEMNSSWWVQHGSALASTWLENPTKFGALWGKSSK